MLEVARLHRLQAVIIIIGTEPDQECPVLAEYLEQCLLGRPEFDQLRCYLVLFDCQSKHLYRLARILASVSSNISLHCYSTFDENAMRQSDAMITLKRDLGNAQVCSVEPYMF